MNSAVVNMCVERFEYLFSVLLGIYLRVDAHEIQKYCVSVYVPHGSVYFIHKRGSNIFFTL